MVALQGPIDELLNFTAIVDVLLTGFLPKSVVKLKRLASTIVHLQLQRSSIDVDASIRIAVTKLCIEEPANSNAHFDAS